VLLDVCRQPVRHRCAHVEYEYRIDKTARPLNSIRSHLRFAHHVTITAPEYSPSALREEKSKWKLWAGSGPPRRMSGCLVLWPRGST